MAPRAMWTGQLRLSLVSIGVRMYSATESSTRVSMNQLHKDCHQRVKNQLTCPVHGPIGRDEVVKGYEYEKDKYVIIDKEDLDGLRLESTKTIDLVQFVDADDIDPMFVDSPYYLGPDGPVAEEPFQVIREALQRAGKAGVGKIVMSGRERIVSVGPHEQGFLMTTLRYAAEVREAEKYFGDLKAEAVDEEQVALAESIIASKSSAFDPAAFTDQYREAFFEIVKAKVAGEAPVEVDADAPPASFNFMDALKQSVEAAGLDGGATKKPAAKSTRKTSSKKKKKSSGAVKKPAATSVKSTKKKTSRKQA